MFKLRGVVPPMITPFDQDGGLDVSNLEKLLDFLIDKVDGLYICGSYGSGPMMSVQERKTVAEVCVKRVEGRIPIIAHTGTTNTKDTVELTIHAEQIGCQGAAAVGPYYYHYGPDSISAFYASMLNGVSPDFPIYVYHNPQFSGYEISLDTLKALKEMGIHGIKDATFNMLTFATYMRELGGNGFDIALGTEALWLSACSLGAEAYIPGLGNAFPEICGQLFEEGMQGHFRKCRQTQFKVNRMREIMYIASSTQLSIYAMLDIRGVIKAYPRSPFVPATEEEEKGIREALEELEMI